MTSNRGGDEHLQATPSRAHQPGFFYLSVGHGGSWRLGVTLLAGSLLLLPLLIALLLRLFAALLFLSVVRRPGQFNLLMRSPWGTTGGASLVSCLRGGELREQETE